MIWEIDDSRKAIEGVGADGRPDPAYAAALGLLPAPLGRRALAAVIDIAIVMVLQLPFWLGSVPLLLKLADGSISTYGFVNHPSFVLAVAMAAVTVALTLIYGVVQLVLQGTRGVTVGKAITGIRTVNVRTLERPKVGPVLLRFLIVVASGLVPLVGPVLMLSSPAFDPDKRRRGWHDLAARVWLVDVRLGLNPFDEKRMRVARKMVLAEPVAERAALPSLATPVHPGAQAEYRPGSRVSAGVLGVARPHDARRRPEVGLPEPTPAPQPAAGEVGKPVLGGYRSPASGDESSAPSAPPSVAAPAAPVAAPPAATPPASAPAPQATPPLTVALPPKAEKPVPVEPVSVALPPKAATPASAAPTPPAGLGLLLDTGERIELTGPVLLGRNPDASVHAGARAIPMPDDSRSLSKTHLLVRPVAGGLEVTDCRSTNGSGLVRAGVEYSIAADTPILTIEGDQIRLGDRIATVLRG